MSKIETILHPTDFSANSDCAFRLAGSLARDLGARLILLHVQPAAFSVAEQGVPVPVAPIGDRDALWSKLKAQRAKDPAVTVEYQLRLGDVAEEIVRFAEDPGCNLIVIGTHGRTGLGRLLMGSVAEQVLRRAPCPVLTVKHASPEVKPPPRAREPVTAT
jgi:nucleotide-binding universal stress UspA family protein